MANRLIKHLLGYDSAGNSGYVVADEVSLAVLESIAVVGVCTDWSGNVYLSDAEKHIILKVTEGGIIQLLAGEAGISGTTNGLCENARFNEPMGIDCDRSGNIYVADCGNNQIRKIDTNGNVSLLAGSLTGVAGSTDGANFDAKFNKPVDVKVDASGNVYISDTGNNKIRLIRGAITVTAAGTGVAGDVLGAGDVAQFDAPYGISCDRSGKIFVADSGNSKIKMIQTDFTVYGVVGPDFNDGSDNFGSLKYLEVDNSGFIYVVDYNETDEVSRLIKFNQEGIGGIIVPPIVTKIGIAVSPNQSIYVTQSGVDFNSSSSESSVSSVSSNSSSSSSSSQSSLSSISSSSSSSSSQSSLSSISSSSSSSSSQSSLSSISSSSSSSSSLSSISSSSSSSSSSSLSSISSSSSSSSSESSLSSLSSQTPI